MVPGARIELATPAFSGRRSTNELPRLWELFNFRDDGVIAWQIVYTPMTPNPFFISPSDGTVVPRNSHSHIGRRLSLGRYPQ